MKLIIDNFARITVIYRVVNDLPLDGYIARENTKNFDKQLGAEADPETRRILLRLRAIEKIKLEKILAERGMPGQGEQA